MRPRPVEPQLAPVERLRAPAPPRPRPHLNAVAPHPLADEIEVPVPGPPGIRRAASLPRARLGNSLVAIGMEDLEHLRDLALPAAAVGPPIEPGRPRRRRRPRRQLGRALAPVELLGDLHQAPVVGRPRAVGQRARGAGGDRGGRAPRRGRGHRDRIGPGPDEPGHQVLTPAEDEADRLQAAHAAGCAPAQQTRRDDRSDLPAAGVGELQHAVEALRAPPQEAPHRPPWRARHDGAIRTRRLRDHRTLAHPIQPRAALQAELATAEVPIARERGRHPAEPRVDLDAAGGPVRPRERRRRLPARPGAERRPPPRERALVAVGPGRVLAAPGEVAGLEIAGQRPERRFGGDRGAPLPAIGIAHVGAQAHEDRITPHGLERRLPQRRPLNQVRHLDHRLGAARRGHHQGRLGDMPEGDGPRRADEIGPGVPRRRRRDRTGGGVRIRGNRRDHDPRREAGKLRRAPERAVDLPDGFLPRGIDLGAEQLAGRVYRVLRGPGRLHISALGTPAGLHAVAVPEGLADLLQHAVADALDLLAERPAAGLQLVGEARAEGGRVPLAQKAVEALVERLDGLPDGGVEAIDDVLADRLVRLIAGARQALGEAVLLVVAGPAAGSGGIGIGLAGPRLRFVLSRTSRPR